MGEAALRRITVDEFLRWDSGDDLRYELVGGEIAAMTPPANTHAIVVNNAKDAIKAKLRPPYCVSGTDLWTVVELESGAVIPPDAIGFDIPVEALYEGLDFTQGAA